MKQLNVSFSLFVLLYWFSFTSFNDKAFVVGNKPVATKTYVLSVTVSNSCSPTNWSVSYSCGNGSASNLTSRPIVGGGGTGNPHGHDVLEYLFYQSLSPQNKNSFKLSPYASELTKNDAKFKAFEIEMNTESPRVMEKTSMITSSELQNSLKELETEISKIQDAQVKQRLNIKLIDAKQKANMN